MRSRRDRAVRIAFCGLALALSFGCTSEGDGTGSASSRAGSAASGSDATVPAKRLADPRPSVLLVVIDTLRADAVSTYGAVEGTTPVLDELGAHGIRYERAYAPAPFTAASHASLFTGLRVDEHGVGLSVTPKVPGSLRMLAEEFRDAGYQTVGLSENSLLRPDFGFAQGFEAYALADVDEVVDQNMSGGDSAGVLRLLDRVETFVENRDPMRPYFAFVNIIDPHAPYIVRPDNPWLPESVGVERAEVVKGRYLIPMSICHRMPPPEDLEILRGLYLGDVAAADRKLGELLRILERSASDEPLLTIVTSDHGEHLGEHRLMGHRFSVRRPVLRIPLFVAGLPDVAPAVIESPVETRALFGSILCWALGRDCPADLPVTPGDVTDVRDDPIFSIWSDEVTRTTRKQRDRLGIDEEEWNPDFLRESCGDEDLVHGDMVSMIRYPMKATWIEGHEIQLHDLSWDPNEISDQRRVQSEVADPLVVELRRFVEDHILTRERASRGEVDVETTRTLKSLGYIE